MNEDEALVIVAALVKKLGGTVTITHNEIIEAMDLSLYRSEDFSSFGDAIKFSVEDSTVIQGVVV